MTRVGWVAGLGLVAPIVACGALINIEDRYYAPDHDAAPAMDRTDTADDSADEDRVAMERITPIEDAGVDDLSADVNPGEELADWDGTRPAQDDDAEAASDVSDALSAPLLATVDVLWAGTDGSLWRRLRVQGTWRTSEKLSPGPLGSPPHPVGPGTGVEDVYWRGTDNNLWHMFYVPPGTGWSGTEQLPSGPIGEPQPLSPSPGVVDVFWRSTDNLNNLMHIFFIPGTGPGTGWNPYESLGAGNLASVPHPVALGSGSEDVFWIGSDSNLWHMQYISGATRWSYAENLLTGPTGEPQPVSPSPGVVDVLWKGTDNNLWHKLCAQGCGQGTWQANASLATGPVGSDPHPVAPGNGVEDVFWRGADNNLWHEYYSPGADWKGPAKVTNFSPGDTGLLISDPQPLSPQPGVVEVFWQGADNNPWHIVSTPDGSWSTPPENLGPGSLGSAPRPLAP